MIRLRSQLLAAILRVAAGAPVCPGAKSHRQRSKRNQWSGELHLRPGGQPQADDLNARAGASGPVELRRQRSLHGGDTYDNNGNTASSGGIANVYDFENHLIQKGGATIVHDGNGNPVGKTVADVTTTYLVDTRSSIGRIRLRCWIPSPRVADGRRGPLCTCLAATIDPWDISRSVQPHRRHSCGYFLLQTLSQYRRYGPRP
jgi:hypothetical protein